MKISIIGSMALAMTMAGCSSAKAKAADRVDANIFITACRALGVCDEPVPAPILLDLVCDGTAGSSCRLASVSETLDVVLPVIAGRPGSLLRVWSVGATVADTTMVAVQKSTAPTKAGTKARRAHEQRFIAAATGFILKALEPTFENPGKRSPLFQALTRVALEGGVPGLSRSILVISDAREFSALADFECGVLPTPAGFVKKLQREQILPPSSLSGIQVAFSFVTVGVIDGKRCDVNLAREAQMKALWQAAVTGAGASDFWHHAGVAQAGDFTNERSEVGGAR